MGSVWGFIKRNGISFTVGFAAGAATEAFTGLAGKLIAKVKGH